jgi:hypothetical protein
MSRSIGTSLNANLASANRRPQWLLRLGNNRYASTGTVSGGTVIYGGFSWVQAPFEVQPFQDHAVVPQITVVFYVEQGDKTTFTAVQPSDACELYATAALSTFAGSNDVVEIFSGTVGGGWALDRNTWTQDIGDYGVWPEKLNGPNSGLSEVATPGVYTFGSDTTYVVTLERGF